MLRSVIFFSTPTSATGSMWRVLMALAQGRYRPLGWVDERYAAQRMDLVATEVPPAEGQLVLHNAPAHFNRNTRLRDYRFILNARDPRDLLCNQYHWQFAHPFPGETPAEEEARRARIAAQGIDAWVLAQDFRPLLKGFFDTARRIAPPDRVFIGYALYCRHFDDAIRRMAAFLGTPLEGFPAARRAALERESVAHLPENPAWIGRQWTGADTEPGRHRHELQPETIRHLSERYRWFLDFLRHMDDPRMAETYA
jgi:hypothetical protein